MSDIHIRGLDPEIWQGLRIEAIKQRISVAKLIELMWREYAIRRRPDDNHVRVA